MCKAGGPYCYGHMKKRLDRAKERLIEKDTPFARKSLAQAITLYDSTPGGQEELQGKIDAVEGSNPQRAKALQARLDRARRLHQVQTEAQSLKSVSAKEAENEIEREGSGSQKTGDPVGDKKPSTPPEKAPLSESDLEHYSSFKGRRELQKKIDDLSSEGRDTAHLESIKAEARKHKEAKFAKAFGGDNLRSGRPDPLPADVPAGYKRDDLVRASYTTDEDGKTHSINDQPAMLYDNGNQVWMKHGVFHRDGDKPSMMHPNGRLEYRKEGVLHREGGNPAVVTSEGEFRVYQNGEEVPQKGEFHYYDTIERKDKIAKNVPTVVLAKMNNYTKASDKFDSRGHEAHDEYASAVGRRLAVKDHRGAVGALSHAFENLQAMDKNSTWLSETARQDYLRIAEEEKKNTII